MIFGREREIRKLVLNLRQGTHTLIFGVPGAGRTAILQAASSKFVANRLHVVYINNCRSRRNLLENALANLRKNNVRTQGVPVKDLRDKLLEACKKERHCLVLDHVPTKLHHRMQRLLEMLETRCTLAFGVTAIPDAYHLYYWKFDKLEVKNMP